MTQTNRIHRVGTALAALPATTRRRAASTALAAIVAVALLGSTAPAHAYTSTFQAQPGHPASTLAMSVTGKPRVGRLVTLTVSGFNAPFPEPFDPDFPDRQPLDYTLDVFVQDRSVFSTCESAETDQIDRIINLPSRIKHITFNAGVGNGGAFRKTVIYRSWSARRIMFCAFIRYSATDDIVMASLKHDMARKPKTARRR